VDEALANVCNAVHEFAWVRSISQFDTEALPLYEVPVRVEPWDRLFKFEPRATPEIVEFARYAFVIELFGRFTAVFTVSVLVFTKFTGRLVVPMLPLTRTNLWFGSINMGQVVVAVPPIQIISVVPFE
jgi:hypothetical protein